MKEVHHFAQLSSIWSLTRVSATAQPRLPSVSGRTAGEGACHNGKAVRTEFIAKPCLSTAFFSTLNLGLTFSTRGRGKSPSESDSNVAVSSVPEPADSAPSSGSGSKLELATDFAVSLSVPSEPDSSLSVLTTVFQ